MKINGIRVFLKEPHPYDFTEAESQRKVYYGLELEENIENSLDKSSDWLLDPLNPHEIAAQRTGAYTRFTILSIVKCLIEYADSEYAADTAESLPRARVLYETALDLLNGKELSHKPTPCSEMIATLSEEIGGDGEWNATLHEVSRIEGVKKIEAAVAEIKKNAMDSALAIEDKIAISNQEVFRATRGQKQEKTISDMAIASYQPALQATLAGISSEAVLTSLESVTASSTALSGWSSGAIYSWMTYKLGFCIPPNPVLSNLRFRAELNLYKLRSGLNIAGMNREVAPYAADSGTVTGLPMIGAEGQLTLPATAVYKPTPYRYAVLVDRARQLVGIAAQIEAAMLAAIEKGDAEAYNLLKARQDLHLANANVQLQNLRVTEAEHGEKLAELQKSRSQLQVDHYSDLLAAGLTTNEKDGLQALNDAANSYGAVAGIVPGGELGKMLSVLGLGDYFNVNDAMSGAQAGAALGLPGALAGGFGGGFGLFGSANRDNEKRAKLNAQAARYSTLAQIKNIGASYERREQEWTFQKNLANKDVDIGAQQEVLAQDRTRIVGQERQIAEMQLRNAEDVLNFLNNKFTNAELYDWMSDVLEGVYRYFLQQATSLAKLATGQLAFERQEALPSFIQTDYWVAPLANAGAGNNQATDRRGLTGSARLLQDIYRLDQYAFETNKRKLQLTRTFSLAMLDPYAFQRFRETGVLPFSMPMRLFDRDFPGHYLRLMKRVRTSVIALIPPTEGIKATLSSTGLSRVVIGEDAFRSVLVRRDPETVALSSPLNASGIFELEPQTDLLFPFESTGVDSNWEFRLPKPANRFDYRTIADVLFTVEYTALNSFALRQQVIQSLNPIVNSDQPFSLRTQFPDQWYDLHNPDQTDTPMTVWFRTFREDFPPNQADLRIEQVILYFARFDGEKFEVPVSGLFFREQGGAGKVGGAATTIDGVISTRRGNGGALTGMIGRSPFGEWELSLPDNSFVREIFEKEKIEDVLLVITYGGRTPEWPI